MQRFHDIHQPPRSFGKALQDYDAATQRGVVVREDGGNHRLIIAEVGARTVLVSRLLCYSGSTT